MLKRGLWSLVVLVACAAGALAQQPLQQLRVGIFQMEPLNYIDADGKAQGLNPDLLREIALRRGRWRPEFVPIIWAEGLEKLESEELDLLVSVTYSPARTAFLDFTEEPVLDIWSQVYVRTQSDVQALRDLQDRRVGILRRASDGESFIRLADAYGLEYEVSEYDSCLQVFEALRDGDIDAGVMTSHYGLLQAQRYGLRGTEVRFAPASIHFAVKKGLHADILADIDAVLSEWRSDPNSYYYWRVDHWLGSKHAWSRGVPAWFKLFLGLTIAASAAFLGLSGWFRREVKIRTQQLKESKDRLQEAHRIARLGRWDRDFETGRVEWSNGMYDILGRPLSANTDFKQFTAEADRERCEQVFSDALELQDRYELEYRVELPGGAVKWVRESGEFEYDEAGKPLRAYGTLQDISDQVEAMQAYRNTNERLRLATKAGQVGIWEYDFAADLMIWDDQMFEVYGLSREKFEGRYESWRQMIHPDDRKKTDEAFSRAIEGHVTFESEFRIVTEALQVKYVRVLADFEYDAAGKPSRLIGMSWDVTYHRQMVEALSASERDYRQLFENMMTGFFLIEVLMSRSGAPDDFKMVQVNEAAAEMASMKRQEMIGQTLKDVFDPLEQAWVDVFSKVAMTAQPCSYEGKIGSLNLIASAWIFVPRPGYLGVVLTDNTARRAAEEAVKSTQQQMQHIFDNSSDVIFKTDEEGRFTYLNSAAEGVSGYAVHELLGRNILDLVVPAQRAEMEARIKARVQGKSGPGSFYFEMHHRSGRKIILEIATTAIFDSDRRLEAIHGIARDVTERIAAERELEQSRQFLRTIIDTIPARVFWKDRNSVYLGCNAAFASDAGLGSPDAIIGLTDFDLSWAETEAELYRQDDLDIMNNEIERINYEEPQTHGGEGTSWLSTSKVPIRDADGKVIGLLGAYEDITARKALEEERSRLSSAISQSAEAIAIMDLNGVIQYVNPAFETVTGFSEEVALGRNFEMFRSGENDPQLYIGIWKTIKAGEAWSGRLINRTREGSLYTAESAISPIRDADGNTEYYVVGLRDVSRQVELEEHIRQAQKMDAVGRLAGGVAHDFNNILQSILGFCGILIGELEADTSQYEDVLEIRNAARRAGDLTRQLLTLSRKHNVEYAVQDLNEVIRSNEKMMRRLIGEHIELSYELDTALKPIRADHSQLEQIILNLFINARDAMPEGGRLQVKTRNVSAADEQADAAASPHGQICLEVSDSGQGIREEVREHLFEPFFTTKQVGEGTGLGLSVVYGIVQQHRGHIDVSSTVGRGSVFQVYLPACAPDAEVSAHESTPGMAEECPLDGLGERILVVEDDAVLRELSQRMLRNAGYTVTAVATVKEAGELDGASCFDLILADLILPDGNGLDLARQIHTQRPETAVLLCSGYSHDPEVHQKMRRFGFRYIEKPVGSMQLLQTVREMLDETCAV